MARARRGSPAIVDISSKDLTETMSRLEIAKKRYGGSHDLPSLDGLREMVAATLWAGFRKRGGRTLAFALPHLRHDARRISFRPKPQLKGDRPCRPPASSA